jgi:hypothetical protein
MWAGTITARSHSFIIDARSSQIVYIKQILTHDQYDEAEGTLCVPQLKIST